MVSSRAVRAGIAAIGLTLTASPNPFHPLPPAAAAQVRDSLPAVLLGQIADAASRFRTGRMAWVVYCIAPPRIVIVVDTEAPARTAAAAAGPRCGQIGVLTPPPDTAVATPATLGRLLAEAADGFRTGLPTWFVARDSFPHQPLIGPFATYEMALDSARLCLTEGCRVHGPFVGIPDGGSPVMAGGCVHFSRTWWVCSPVPPVGFGELDSLRLTYFPRGGDPFSLHWGTWEVDAIFLTQAAIDKFALPYYASLYGAAYAAELLRMPRP
jgi:hypothetical protein